MQHFLFWLVAMASSTRCTATHFIPVYIDLLGWDDYATILSLEVDALISTNIHCLNNLIMNPTLGDVRMILANGLTFFQHQLLYSSAATHFRNNSILTLRFPRFCEGLGLSFLNVYGSSSFRKSRTLRPRPQRATHINQALRLCAL